MSGVSQEIRDEYNTIMRDIEAKLAELSHRERGGFGTEDQKFASEMFDMMTVLWRYTKESCNRLDEVAEMKQCEINDLESEVEYYRDLTQKMRNAVNSIADTGNFYNY